MLSRFLPTENQRLLILLLAILLINFKPLQAEEKVGIQPDFDPALALRLLEKEDAILLDIRTEKEFRMEHLEGATFITFQDFRQFIREIELLTGGEKDYPIVLYCHNGQKAEIVKKVLLQEGFTMVANAGGMKDLQKEVGISKKINYCYKL